MYEALSQAVAELSRRMQSRKQLLEGTPCLPTAPPHAAALAHEDEALAVYVSGLQERLDALPTPLPHKDVLGAH